MYKIKTFLFIYSRARIYPPTVFISPQSEWNMAPYYRKGCIHWFLATSLNCSLSLAFCSACRYCFFFFLAESTCEPHFVGFVKNIIKMLYKGLGQIGLDPRTYSKQNLKEYMFIEKVCSLGFPPACFNLVFCLFCYEIPQRSETVACLIKAHHLQDVDKCWHLSC